jgi:hypothetical protein
VNPSRSAVLRKGPQVGIAGALLGLDECADFHGSNVLFQSVTGFDRLAIRGGARNRRRGTAVQLLGFRTPSEIGRIAAFVESDKGVRP